MHEESIKVVYKLIPLFLLDIARHAQITQNNKFALSLACLKNEGRDKVVFKSNFPTTCYYHFGKYDQSHPKHPKYTFAKSLKYLKKEVRDGVKFFVHINIKFDTIILDRHGQAYLKYTK